MKRINYFFLMLSFVAIALTGCSDAEEELVVDESERILGKWTVDTQWIFETEFPGDGSWLSFDGCTNGDCSGVDYMASDETSGTFTYSFGNDKTTIILVDNDPEAGGSYSGEWTIEEFTNNKLVISNDTGLFGVLRISLKK